MDRLQFFVETLQLLSEKHVKLFTSLILNPKFKSTLFSLLKKGETAMRLKAHEILEIVATYFITYCSSKTLYEIAVPRSASLRAEQVEMMEVDFISCERLYIA